MTTPPFIVAEISKNWQAGRSVANPLLLAEQFEQAINHNAARGYELLTFELCRLVTGEESLNETIIAVFRYVGAPVAAANGSVAGTSSTTLPAR